MIAKRGIMDRAELPAVDSVLSGLQAAGGRQLCRLIAQQAARDTGLPEAHILSRLEEQERSASSGTGRGVAIPHLRLRRLEKPYSLFARLRRPVDFDAVDGLPVDHVFLLLSPERDVAGHLRRLSRVSRLMRDEALCRQLRGADDPEACRALLDIRPEQGLAA